VEKHELEEKVGSRMKRKTPRETETGDVLMAG
jgi:hypothetical protein